MDAALKVMTPEISWSINFSRTLRPTRDLWNLTLSVRAGVVGQVVAVEGISTIVTTALLTIAAGLL